MRKFTVFIITLFCLLLCTTSVLAEGFGGGQDDGFKFGMKFSFPFVSKTDDINGGGYLSLDTVFSFTPNAELTVGYLTDLTPNLFSDNLISVTQQFVVNSFSMGNSEYQMYLGLSYLKSSKDNYYGFKFCPIHLGRTASNQNAIMDGATFNYLYSPDTSNHVIIFEFVAGGAYF